MTATNWLRNAAPQDRGDNQETAIPKSSGQ